jgi:hypothetical protein
MAICGNGYDHKKHSRQALGNGPLTNDSKGEHHLPLQKVSLVVSPVWHKAYI